MTVGQDVLMGDLSYMAFARETAFGVYSTATSGLNTISMSMKAMKETKILEEIQGSRTNSNFIQLGKTIEGEAEFYYSPRSLACQLILQNALGAAPVVSSSLAAGAYSHQFDIGNFGITNSSLSINHRKGDPGKGKIFEYRGIRINELSFAAEIDEPLACSISMMAKDVTTSANDISAQIDTSLQKPLSFVSGRLSVEASVAALTSTSHWCVQSFEMKINNNINVDAASRCIGSDVIEVMPPGLAVMEFKATLRYDTLTAYDAMMNGTVLAAEMMFQGATLPGSTVRESIKLTLPKVVVSDAGDPGIGGPNEPLTSEVTFAVMRDDATTTGYMVRAVVVNGTASY